MERMPHGNDLIIRAHSLIIGISFRNLQQSLYSFRAAVGKKHLLHARSLQKLFSGFNRGHIVKQIRRMAQLVHLHLQRLIEFPAVVSQTHYSDSCPKIQIFLSVRIIQAYSLPPVKHNGKTVIDLIQCLLRPIYILLFLHIHLYSFRFTHFPIPNCSTVKVSNLPEAHSNPSFI